MTDHRTFARTLRGTFYELDPDLSLFQVQAFMYIATHPGCPQYEVQEYLETSNAVTSRAVKRWSELEGGFGLIRSEIDPADRRHRLLFLTDEGKAMVDRIKELNYAPSTRK